MTRAINEFTAAGANANYRYGGKIRPRGDALYATPAAGTHPDAIVWPVAFKDGDGTAEGGRIVMADGLIEVIETVATLWLYGPEAATLAEDIRNGDVDHPGEGAREILASDLRRLIQRNIIPDDGGFPVLSIEVKPSAAAADVGHWFVEVHAVRATNA